MRTWIWVFDAILIDIEVILVGVEKKSSFSPDWYPELRR
jgi:hypothetical protein